MEREQSERAYFFREQFALTYNINRGENTPSISGSEVYPLPSDNAIQPKAPSQEQLSIAKGLIEKLNSKDGN